MHLSLPPLKFGLGWDCIGWNGMGWSVPFFNYPHPARLQVDVREGLALDTLAAMVGKEGEVGRWRIYHLSLPSFFGAEKVCLGTNVYIHDTLSMNCDDAISHFCEKLGERGRGVRGRWFEFVSSILCWPHKMVKGCEAFITLSWFGRVGWQLWLRFSWRGQTEISGVLWNAFATGELPFSFVKNALLWFLRYIFYFILFLSVLVSGDNCCIRLKQRL